ncbi:MAG: alpha/beta hydrolase fold domain-containing protein [Anaerolineae bacterium]|nr:alpha/beta hydrolase fold domain-containing protein [Anaerolineae bacterium]
MDSFRYFGDGLWLSTASMGWYRDHYLQNREQATSPLVSPLLTDNLGGLPPGPGHHCRI